MPLIRTPPPTQEDPKLGPTFPALWWSLHEGLETAKDWSCPGEDPHLCSSLISEEEIPASRLLPPPGCLCEHRRSWHHRAVASPPEALLGLGISAPSPFLTRVSLSSAHREPTMKATRRPSTNQSRDSSGHRARKCRTWSRFRGQMPETEMKAVEPALVVTPWSPCHMLTVH